jgi:arabinan endo-1,5-alpha-L-arabinosidase
MSFIPARIVPRPLETKTMMRRCSALALACVLTAVSLAVAQSERRRRPPVPRQRPSYTNPVLNADFPDPTVIHAADGLYYAYATQTNRGGRDINIQVARSADLVAWEHLGDALPAKPVWASGTQKFWAPHVSRHGDTYFMYYSAEPNSKDGLCLAAATSKAPAGPFVDSGRPLQCGEGFVNIDPMALDDPATGRRLLYWGSGFKPIKVRELAADRISFAPGSEPTDLISPKPGSGYQRLVEGAWVVRRGGWYYLFYSGDNCCGVEAHYAVMVARSRNATGPFQSLGEARCRSESTVLVRSERWNAPGHNSIVTDAAGQDWTFYHAIDPAKPKNDDSGGDRRVMLMDRVTYREGWPVIGGGVPATGARPGPRVR